MAAKQYIYFLRPTRPEMLEGATAEEEAAVDAHFEYLKRATEAGQCILARRCTDIAYGIVVFEAADDEAATAFRDNDPAVVAKVMHAELHPYRVALLRGN